MKGICRLFLLFVLFLFLSAYLLAISGCAPAQEKPKIQIVHVQVPVACVDKVPERPDYRFGKGVMPEEGKAVAILMEDHEKNLMYTVTLEALLTGCVK